VRYAIAAYVAALVILFVLEVALALAGLPLEIADGALLFEIAFLLTLVPLWRSGRLGIRDLGLRPVPGARSTGLVLVGLLAYGWFSVLWVSGLNLPHTTSNFSGISHQSLGAILVAGFVASVGAPVAEEVFFRGFLYRSLRNRLSILPACLLSATMFGLLHTQYPLAVRPILVFFGVIACLLYERTGSLLPGIALHCIVDAGGFESALTGNERVVATLFVLLALVLLARASRRFGTSARTRRCACRWSTIVRTTRSPCPTTSAGGRERRRGWRSCLPVWPSRSWLFWMRAPTCSRDGPRAPARTKDTMPGAKTRPKRRSPASISPGSSSFARISAESQTG